MEFETFDNPPLRKPQKKMPEASSPELDSGRTQQTARSASLYRKQTSKSDYVKRRTAVMGAEGRPPRDRIDDLIIRMWPQDKSLPQIAEVAGVTASTVHRRGAQMGLPPKTSRAGPRKDARMRAQVLAMMNTHSVATIARRLSTSRSQIYRVLDEHAASEAGQGKLRGSQSQTGGDPSAVLAAESTDTGQLETL